MSASKYKFYEIQLTAVVRANSKADAIRAIYGDEVDAQILAEHVDGQRLNAPAAKTMAAQL